MQSPTALRDLLDWPPLAPPSEVAVAPLAHQELPAGVEQYSQRAPDFASENHEILQAIETVARATGERGIWVMDRGRDRQEVLEPLLNLAPLIHHRAQETHRTASKW